MTESETLLKVPEAARLLQASDSFVYAACSSGRLKHYRLGKGHGGIRISRAQLSEFLRNQERGGDGASLPPPQRVTHSRYPSASPS